MKHQGGSTLVELVAVLAIMGLGVGMVASLNGSGPGVLAEQTERAG